MKGGLETGYKNHDKKKHATTSAKDNFPWHKNDEGRIISSN